MTFLLAVVAARERPNCIDNFFRRTEIMCIISNKENGDCMMQLSCSADGGRLSHVKQCTTHTSALRDTLIHFIYVSDSCSGVIEDRLHRGLR